ncbi:MAG TPA: PHP domain-containing protein [Candidatus Hydrogenedentes bacterium]|nr:PHP domain-containing protein [Candidatus Hydrogenedentota bacterium]HPC16560.1 PHP domain-containing protein [Candidatus Hydrogenedentota bacterium]HRT18941.1 PHP domain-containing protein [Candidatus Hydrogenedentota bacterium]HRT64947.1 PHP domain-containing protein [Candidatus Hydrogenedentota bacterium]
MTPYADLHLHTNHSDGSDRPERVIERAAALGFSAVAIADHDTITSVAEARERAYAIGMGFLTGVEISASYGHAEVHVLGLGLRVEDEDLRKGLASQREARSRRIDQILDELKRCGVEISRDEIEAQLTGGGALGRVHIARALKDRGITKTVQEGFDRFIRSGRKAYVPKAAMPCREAIDLIHSAGGLAFLAHPGVGSAVPKLLPTLLKMPFDGLEAFHTKHTPTQTKSLIRLAEERGLLISGGSDCHGTAIKKEPDMGAIRLPMEYVERIREALARHQTCEG